MGNGLKKAEMVQRRANKAFTDPHFWDHQRKARAETDGVLGYDPKRQAANAVRVATTQGTMDADIYYKEMERVEREERDSSKVDPRQVTDALRMKLFQQRQYISYKDTMMRMGVPEESVLGIDKWVEEYDTPMEADLEDRWHLMADRVSLYEIPYTLEDDPNMHDLFAPIEEGDNRLSESMLIDLVQLQEEGKLDCETAGKMLNRSPEVLRRVVAPIRKVPLCHVGVPNVDVETWMGCVFDGKDTAQIGLERFGGIRGMMRRIMEGEQKATNYKFTGEFPENIPAIGFQPPVEARGVEPTSGPGYSQSQVFPN
eukprot:TRINITY_DN16424_c0_g1_i1.p1 TRINITY_DN16424_c0_g1~~TRINITY_DN16424_c0_g1_i1.p1  ORF type:complete len:313 (+),score=73.30 TRINITY_DN16424_c0_g1_i1:75-1013(+)